MRETQDLGEAPAILTHRVVGIAYVETEVERVVGCDAHATRSGRKCMAKAVAIQKGRMQGAHSGF